MIRVLAIAFLAFAQTALAQEKPVLRIAAGTTIENSGLADALIPAFEASSGLKVELLPMGTGQALKVAESGDVDVIVVHSPKDEEAFMAKGLGSERRAVMYNDFVIVGPEEDPAGIATAKHGADALRAIADAQAPFVSRGDESGTHQKERTLWSETGFDPQALAPSWYRSVGAGMGATLNIAAASGAYTIADRGTWGAYENKTGMRLLLEGDPDLVNQYSVIVVEAKRHPHINAQGARAFADWITGSDGQSRIASFRKNGQQLFFPNAKPGT